MMFSNGLQGKGKNSTQEQRDTGTRVTSTQVLLAQINGKLNNGFKDNLTKSLGRLLRSKVQMRPDSNVRPNNTVKEQPNGKSKIIRLPSSSSKKYNCTALNDKNTGEFKITQTPTIVSERLLKSRVCSIEGQASWVPTLKTSLQRSLSLQPGKIDRESIEKFGRRKDQRNRTLRETRRQCSSGSGLLQSNGRRLKGAISQSFNKYDSWLSNGSKISFAAVFILLNLLLPLANYAAPLPANLISTNNILNDLIADYEFGSSRQQEPNEQIDRSPPPAIAIQQLLSNLASTLDSSRAETINRGPTARFEELRLVAGGDGDVGFGRRGDLRVQNLAKSYEVDFPSGAILNSLYGDGSGGLDLTPVSPREELLEIHRRRLERDRALEPPPWLREQPMRRGYNPIILDETTGQTSSDEENSESEEQQKQAPNSNRSRQSRELANQIYDEFLRHILEGALNDHKIADELYDELQQRLQVNRIPKLPSRQLAAQALGDDASSTGSASDPQHRLSQQQPSVSSAVDQSAVPMNSPQESEPDSTLVVVGDEVSSEDDVPIGQSAGKSSAMNAAYTLQSGESGYGTIQSNDKSTTPNDRSNPPAVAQTILSVPSVGAADLTPALVAKPVTIGAPFSGIDLLSVDPSINQQSSYESDTNTFSTANSFHVVEDIDRDDGSQITTVDQNPSQVQDSGHPRQEHQFAETSNWPESENSGPIVYSQFMKRGLASGPVLAKKFSKNVAAGRFMKDTRDDIDEFGVNLDSDSEEKDQLAIMLIESGKISRDQLIKAATKLKYSLEEMIDIPRDTVLGLYPLNANQLLVNLDTNKLSLEQTLNLIKNYARTLDVIGREDGNLETRQLSLLGALPPEAADEMNIETPTEAFGGNLKVLRYGVGPGENSQYQYYPAAYLLTQYQAERNLSPQMLANLRNMIATWALVADPTLEQPAYTGFPSGGNLSQKSAPDANRDSAGRYLHSFQWLAVIAALLGAFLATKLVMLSGGSKLLRGRFGGATSGSRRSNSSASSNTVVGSVAEKSTSELGAANLAAGPRSGDVHLEGLDASEEIPASDKAAAYNLDLLTQRLASLLSHSPFSKMRESPPPGYDETISGRRELDEADCLDNPVADSTGRFRSSGSYIRSLIDVLGKARAQINPRGGPEGAHADQDELSSQADDEISTELGTKSTVLSGSHDEVALPDAGIVMSQMDISAAHLILAYMEKHLEDKERLRREWLELNAGPKRGGSSADKIAQIRLQRLAKVALSEENRHKNRNPLVVPFDRNRVKLGQQQAGIWPAATVSGPTNNNNKLSGSRARGAKVSCKAASDYINASFIYDDDLRRPTHIITQGPSEQTGGQFWQMVWEQGVSVIVMLTRLNENSTRMCHCYWPTSADRQQQQQRDCDTNGSNGAGPESQCPKKPELVNNDNTSGSNGSSAVASTSPSAAANGRRVSVTSVFNAIGARLNPNGQPIIANGDFSDNNILCFDVVSPTATTGSGSAEADSLEVEDGGGEAARRAARKHQAAADHQAPITRFEVHLVSEHVSSSDYLVRNMYMVNRSTGETRTITQFHYLAWPENGVPDNVKSFLQFRRKVHKSYRNLRSPILVHCSDGGGRSGTYTLIDIILERIKNGAKEIDPRATLEHLRDQRVGLCATQSQFEFVLVALAEEIQIILNALPQ